MTKITIFTKYGDIDTEVSLVRYIMGMAKCLKETGGMVTITPNVQIHFEVRIDGQYYKFGDSAGCSHLRFLKKRGVIANTIAITQEQLELPTQELLSFFKNNILIGLSQMLDRLIKEKYELDKEQILSVVKKAIDNISQ
ncbi:hypothetical protein [Capnocytophaga canimorsus]|uniref:hypothetical protein n=1 Tax=Capnocytophaga canimorsus TaxID=28188 RepID=UPI00385B7F9F